MIRVLNYGGGIQSTAILVMAVNGQRGFEIDHAIFADTGDEPSEVYATVERAQRECERVGIGFHIVRQGNLLEDMERNGKNKIPCFVRSSPIPTVEVRDPGAPNGWRAWDDDLDEGHDRETRTTYRDGTAAPMSRSCTRDYKINPIRRKIKELLGLSPAQRWPSELAVMQVFGISTDEARRTRVSIDAWCKFDYPLIRYGLNRDHCAALLREEGWEDVTRSACVYCPFHTAEEWRKVWPEHRDKIERAEAAAKRDPSLREEPFLHRSLTPIAEAIENLPEQDNEFFGMQEECLGHCGI